MKAILIRPLEKNIFSRRDAFTFMKIYNFIKNSEAGANKIKWISIGHNFSSDIRLGWLNNEFKTYWKILEE